MLVSYPEVEAEFLGTVTQVGVGSDEPVNTVQRDLRWGCLLEIGKQAERFFHNTTHNTTVKTAHNAAYVPRKYLNDEFFPCLFFLFPAMPALCLLLLPGTELLLRLLTGAFSSFLTGLSFLLLLSIPAPFPYLITIAVGIPRAPYIDEILLYISPP